MTQQFLQGERPAHIGNTLARLLDECKPLRSPNSEELAALVEAAKKLQDEDNPEPKSTF